MDIRLDLGSGTKLVLDTFIGADLCGEHDLLTVKPGQIAKVDLHEFPWPWENDSISEIWSSHYICYQTPAQWVQMVDEIYRILKDGCAAQFIWPNIQSGRAWQDPLYQDHIPLERWKYADKAWRRELNVVGPGYPTCDLTIVAFDWMGMHDDFHARADEVKKFATSHYYNSSADLSITLVKRSADQEVEVVNDQLPHMGLIV